MADLELVKKWVAALRSGKYNQDSGALRTDTGFCCLGVLCDVVDSNLWKFNENCYDEYGEYLLNSYEFMGEYEQLPGEICDRISSSSLGYGIVVGPSTNLAQANDDGATFLEIADAIEKHYGLKQEVKDGH